MSGRARAGLERARANLHLKETLLLAGPVMAARAGILFLALVDTIMTGQVGAAELAYLSLAMTPQLVLMLVGVGMMQGGIVLTAQSFGAGEYERCGRIWSASLLYALVLGAVFWSMVIFIVPLYNLAGIDPELSAGAARVAVHFAWGFPGMLAFIACQYFLEGTKRPKVGMMVMLIANLVNIVLDFVFVLGWGGLVEPMGALGAVATTSFVRTGIFFGLAGYMFFSGDRQKYKLRLGWRLSELRQETTAGIRRNIRRLGAPLGLSQLTQSSAMMIVTLMAGRMGETATAAHQVTTSITQFFYMFTVGMAAATSVRVGQAIGRDDQHLVRMAGITSVVLIMGLLALPAVFMMVTPVSFARLFVDNESVFAIAAVTIAIAGFLVFSDGIMGVLMGGLRGTGDVWGPLGIQMLSHWAVAVPVAGVVAFRLEYGPPGLYVGMFAGSMSAAVLLAIRFRAITGRRIERL